MKYLITSLLGGIIGAGLAAVALYYNPLTMPTVTEPPSSNWTLAYGFPRNDSLVLTHNGELKLPILPTDVPRLWENTINQVAMHVAILKDEQGSPVAIGTRVSMPSSDTDFLLAGAILNDYWLISVPGEGSLFMRTHSNLWPLLKDTVIPVRYLQRQWNGPRGYQPTDGPGFGNRGEVYGASGRFAAQTGSVSEAYELERFSLDGGIEALSGKLRVNLTEKPSLPE